MPQINLQLKCHFLGICFYQSLFWQIELHCVFHSSEMIHFQFHFLISLDNDPRRRVFVSPAHSLSQGEFDEFIVPENIFKHSDTNHSLIISGLGASFLLKDISSSAFVAAQQASNKLGPTSGI